MVRLLATFLSAFFFALSVLAAPSSFSYQGQIVKPNGQPLEGSAVTFTIEILSPLPTECVLYEEQHIINMSNSNGLFALEVGNGTQSGGDYEDLATLSSALSNSTGAVSPTTCVGGPTYTPSTADGRQLRITFDDGTGPNTVSQNHQIVSVPYADSASSIDGLSVGDLLVRDTSGSNILDQSNLVWLFETSRYAELQALINGTSTNYLSGSPSADLSMNSNKIVDVSDPTLDTDAATKGYVDGSIGGQAVDSATLDLLGAGDVGEVLVWSGTEWTSQAPAGDTTKLPLAGGTMTGDIDMNSNNITNANSVSATSVGASSVAIYNGANYMGFQASPGSADLLWVLPAADGSANQGLSTDASGNLSWRSYVESASNQGAGGVGPFKQLSSGDLEFKNINAGSNKVTISDDVGNDEIDIDVDESNFDLGTIPNTAAGNIAATDAQAAINELDSEKVAKAGDSMTGALTLNAQNEVRFADSDSSNYVGFASPAVVASDLVWTLPDADGTPNQVLETDGFGNLQWRTLSAVGETNTASNRGTAGVGVFDNKNGVDFEMRNINDDGNGKITVTLDGPNKEIDLSVDESSLDQTAIPNTPAGNIAATNVQGAINELDTEKADEGDVMLLDGSQAMTANMNLGTNRIVNVVDPSGAQDAATKNYVDSEIGAISTDEIRDADNNTKVQVEEGSNDDTIRFDTAGTERMVIDSSGNVGLGTDNPTQPLSIYRDGAGSYVESVTFRDDQYGGGMTMKHARGTAAAPTVSNQNDVSGAFFFSGYDGDSFENTARIRSLVDGVPADNVMPGRLDFFINDGSTGLVDALTIRSTRYIGIGTTDPNSHLEVTGDIQIGNSSEACGATKAGAMRFTGGNVEFCDGGGTWVAFGTAAGGEVNTASNSGSGGVGLVLAKSGSDLPFKSINAGSSKVTVTNDAGNSEVDINVDESNFDPAVIPNTPAGDIAATNVQAAIDELDSEKVAETRAINTAADSGLQGGGDLSTDRSLSLNIPGVADFAATIANDDTILVYDTDATTMLEIERSDFVLSETEVDAYANNNGYADEGDVMLLDGSQAMTANMNLGTNRIVNVVDPSGAQDAATKNYVDTEIAAISTDEIRDADNNTKVQVEESGNDDTIRFDTAGAERMVVLPGGNVGIGSSSPTTELEVTGTIKSSGPLWSSFGSTGTHRGLLLENYDDTANTNGTDVGVKLGGTEFQGLSWVQETAWTSASAASAKDTMLQFGVLQDNVATIPMVINSGGLVGIGTTNPSSLLTVEGTGGINHTPEANTNLHTIGGDQLSNSFLMDAVGTDPWDGPFVTTRRAQGTGAAPLYPNNGDWIVGYNYKGYDENTGTFENGAAIEIRASEDWSATTRGTRYIFRRAKNGTTAAAEALRIEDDAFRIRTSYLHVDNYGSATGETGQIRLQELSDGNYTGFRAPDALGSNIMYTLPTTAGNANEVLQTNGSGTLSWAPIGASGDGHSLDAADGSPTDVVYVNNDGGVGVGTTTPDYGIGYSAETTVLGVAGDGTASSASTGVLTLANNRATPTLGDTAGTIDFVSQGNGAGAAQMGARIKTVLTGAGGANGFGHDLVLYTKNDNAALISEKARLTSEGYLGIGTDAPASELDVAGIVRAEQICDETGANCRDISSGWGSGGDFMADGSVAMTGELELLSENDASTPDLTFNGDENTGLFQPAADEFAFSNAGTESMRIDASGRVGVGTTAPENLLHVDGVARFSRATSSYIVIDEDDTGNAHDNDWWMVADANTFSIRKNNEAGFPLQILDNKDVVFDAGNVGVGTSTPSSKLTLFDSSGGIESLFEFDRYNIDQKRFSNDASGGGILLTKARGTEATPLVVQDNDEVAELIFRGHDGTNSEELARIDAHVDGTPGNNDMPGRLTFSTTPDGSNTPVERVRINNAGNVGIGTNSPASLLDVAGIIRAEQICDESGANCRDISSGWGSGGDFMADGSVAMTGELELLSENSAADPDLTFNGDENTGLFQPTADEMAFSNAGAETLRINASGSVGVGTTTPTLSEAGKVLHLHQGDGTASAIHFSNTDTGASGTDGGVVGLNSSEALVLGQYGPQPVQFMTDGSERMRIDGSGNVAIGTNAPQGRLTVINSTTTAGVNGLVSVVDANPSVASESFNGSVTAVQLSGSTDTSATTGAQTFVTNLSSGTHGSINLSHDILTSTAGTITNSYGNLVQMNYTNTTVTGEVWGQSGLIASGASSTIADARGGVFGVQGTGVTDGYGVYIFDVEATNDFAIFQAGANDTNYFAGSIGIGTDAPASALDVAGIIRAEQICDESGANCRDISTGWGSGGDFLADGSVPMTGELELLSENDAATPDLTFNGDENTGLFQPATDEIAFSNAGTESMRLDASGNVGIGTNAPGFLLEVNGESRIDRLGLGMDTTTERLAINGNFGMYKTAAAPPYHKFYHANPGMTALASPNPVAETQYFGYDGSAYQMGANLFVGAEETYTASSAGSNFQFHTSSLGSVTPTEKMRISADGDVGIGTAAPARQFHVYTDDNVAQRIQRSNGGQVSLEFVNSDSSPIYVGLNDGNNFSISDTTNITAGSQFMVQRSTGFVGIGVTPAVELDVGNGSINASEICDESNSNCFDLSNGVGEYSSGDTFLAGDGVEANPSYSFASATGHGMYLNGASLGFSISGTRAFNMAGNSFTGRATNSAEIRSAAGTEAVPAYTFTGSNAGMWLESGTENLAFSTNSLERMRINNAGDVGIGTNNPVADLHVHDNGSAATLTVSGTGGASTTISSTSGTNTPGALNMVKYGTTGTPGTNDDLGSIAFYGGDASWSWLTGAEIKASIVGTPTASSMPSSLYFRTTPSGSTTPSTRLLIEPDGDVGIGTTSPMARLHTQLTSGTLPALAGSEVAVFENSGNWSGIAIISDDANGSYVDFGDSSDKNAGSIGYWHTDDHMSFRVNGSATDNVVIDSDGDVGIGTTTPSDKLVVDGTIRNLAAVDQSSNTTIDFASGNIQYTTDDCQAFNLHNMRSGGSYTFVVQGSTSATCSFNAYSDAGSTALTVHMPADHGATTASKHTIYTAIVAGTHIYFAWVPDL